MTLQELHALLKSTGFPVAYHSFKASNITPVPQSPYIVFMLSDTDNFGADNHVYRKISNIAVELYTSKKDLTAELKIEDAFDNSNIFYDKSETYIETEGLFQISYEITI